MFPITLMIIVIYLCAKKNWITGKYCLCEICNRITQTLLLGTIYLFCYECFLISFENSVLSLFIIVDFLSGQGNRVLTILFGIIWKKNLSNLRRNIYIYILSYTFIADLCRYWRFFKEKMFHIQVFFMIVRCCIFLQVKLWYSIYICILMPLSLACCAFNSTWK